MASNYNFKYYKLQKFYVEIAYDILRSFFTTLNNKVHFSILQITAKVLKKRDVAIVYATLKSSFQYFVKFNM